MVKPFKCPVQPDMVHRRAAHSAIPTDCSSDALTHLGEENPCIDQMLIKDLITDLGEPYLVDLLTRLFRSASEALAEMRNLHMKKDFAGAAMLAHRTAGSTALFGLKALHTGLLAYERAIIDGKSSFGAQLLQVLPSVLARTVASLQSCGDLRNLTRTTDMPPIVKKQ